MLKRFFTFLDGEHHMFKWEQLEHTKGGNQVNQRRTGGQAKNHKKDKQWPIKHYTEN
jgi:hypothetical protein